MIVGFNMAPGLKKMAPGGTIGKVVNWLIKNLIRRVMEEPGG